MEEMEGRRQKRSKQTKLLLTNHGIRESSFFLIL